jgi:hypothetical protein
MSLHDLLSRRGSYAAIAAGRFPDFHVRLFDHVGDVYRRVERAAGDDFPQVDALRLTALVHEEPPASIAGLLAVADLARFAPLVTAVTSAFGRVWKVRTGDDLRTFVERHRPSLAAVLLFELAHEGRAIPDMERAAGLGGLSAEFDSWANRLLADDPLLDDGRLVLPTARCRSSR